MSRQMASIHNADTRMRYRAGSGRLFSACCVLGVALSIGAHAALTTPKTPTSDAMASNVTGLFSPLPILDNSVHAELTVGKGDTLISLLLAHDITHQDAHLAANALKQAYDPRDLKVGQTLDLVTEPADNDDEAILKSLTVSLPLATITLASSEEADGFVVTRDEIAVESQPFYGRGTVSSSLYQAASDAEIHEGAMAEIVKAFSFDVDFQRDIHPGNRIEVMFDTRITEDGRVVGYENARYAKLAMKNRTLEIFKFKDARGVEGWFDAKGNSVKKSLLRTPVNAARLSSGFGMRRHPVLGYKKMHRGVDFAAPTGTPIYAAGDGVIDYKGRRGGYGNYIRIRHNGTYQTAYAHMHRYAKGMRKGKAVKQGQVIGYVGTTGRSTGPHLHYEVLQNGSQVNPRHAKFNVADPLRGRQLAAFKKHMAHIHTELASYRDHNAAGNQLAQLNN
jgi:murein DD-endopeptidase MepM/ murein hydrolase activator NlpD